MPVGFVFATATAILRIANKHYSSDVLAGSRNWITVGNFSD
jgi:hypothetical protein